MRISLKSRISLRQRRTNFDALYAGHEQCRRVQTRSWPESGKLARLIVPLQAIRNLDVRKIAISSPLCSQLDRKASRAYIIRRSRDKVAGGDIAMPGSMWAGRSRAAFRATLELVLGRRRQALVTLVLGGIYVVVIWVMPDQGSSDSGLPLRIGATVLPLLA